MICITCGAKASPGVTTDVTDIGTCLIIVRNVPCYKCNECNEIIYTADVVKQLERIVETAKLAMTGIAILDFNNRVA